MNEATQSSNLFQNIRRSSQERQTVDAAIWEPVQEVARAPRPELTDALVADLAAVFRVTPPPAPTHRIAGDLKEAVILRRLGLLGALDSLLVKTRLERDAAGDDLVRAFRSLAEPRRGKILAFLGDARRRAALAAAR